MDLSRNLKALEIPSLDNITLRDLESKIERNVAVKISKQQVLNTYLGWLKEQLVQDSFNQQDSFVETWISSLRDRGFDKEHIHRSFKDWQRREAQGDPSTRRRFLIIEVDICRLLNIPRNDSNYVSRTAGSHMRPSSNKETKVPLPSRSATNKNNKPPLPTYSVCNSRAKKNSKASKRVRFDNPERSGPNELPIVARRPVDLAPHSPSQEIIEIMDDGQSEPDGQSFMIQAAPYNNEDHSSRQAGSDSDEIIITRETIILDSLSETIHPSNDPNNRMPLSKVEYIHGLKTGTLEQQPPGPAYICKRCKKRGHWIHLCPTNLDPGYDVPPPRDYECNFCGRQGHHFATLCPKNDNEWSLTRLRKKAGIQMITKSKRQRSPARDNRSDMYRPDSPSRSRYGDPDKFRSGRRDERPQTYRDKPSPYRSPTGRGGSPEHGPRPQVRNRPREIATKYRADHYRPGELHSNRRDILTKASRQGNNSFRDADVGRKGTEGRLAYEDEDVYVVNDYMVSRSPSVCGAPRTPRIANANSSSETGPNRSSYGMGDDHMMLEVSASNGHQPEDYKQAAADANEFLHILWEEIQENRTAVVCASELDAIMEEVCGNDDPNLVLDEHGRLCRLVTNPPFSEEVVRLCAGRSNPVINPRHKRKTAAHVLEESEQNSWLSRMHYSPQN